MPLFMVFVDFKYQCLNDKLNLKNNQLQLQFLNFIILSQIALSNSCTYFIFNYIENSLLNSVVKMAMEVICVNCIA